MVYLDNMKTALKSARQKKELYQMMEDQYLDLKAQGKSENEAVGEVIAGLAH